MIPILTILSPILLLTALSYFWIRLAVKASGWDDLAEHYHWPAPFDGARWTRQTLHFSFGPMLWRSVNIKANESGLLFEPLFPFAHVAPTIRIPWADLKLTSKGQLHCSTTPKVRVWLSRRLVKRITICRDDYRNPSS